LGKAYFPVFICRSLRSWRLSVSHDVLIFELMSWFVHFSLGFVCFLCSCFSISAFHP